MDLEEQLAHVVMVEDNPDDIEFTMLTMMYYKIHAKITFFRDGEEFVEALKGPLLYTTQDKPDLILLDLNLPRMSGREVLQFMKESETWEDTPVVILSGSSSPKDIEDTTNMGASLYLVKPLEGRSLEDICQHIPKFKLHDIDDERYFIKLLEEATI